MVIVCHNTVIDSESSASLNISEIGGTLLLQ